MTDDRALLWLIKKWLKAGVLDTDGQVLHPATGTPQGGIVSPILANVYLHYALDLWFERVVKQHCRGEACLIRYADDFVCAFEEQKEAERFYKALGQRLQKFGLELAAEKTRVIAFSKHLPAGKESFDFLGFEFRWGKDRAGKAHLKRRTARQKLQSSLKRFTAWCKGNRHLRQKARFAELNRKLRGYYNYYGVIGNSARLNEFYYQAMTILFTALKDASAMARPYVIEIIGHDAESNSYPMHTFYNNGITNQWRSHERSTGVRHAQSTDSSSCETQTLLAAWRWWLPPALLALTLALVFVDPFAGDWDALDYTVLAVQGRPSSMILGRTLFIYANHVLWRIAHALFALPPEKAYLLFKYAVVVQSPLAVIAWWWLARDLTNSVRAATLAALLLALSPFYIIYSGQVMTEIPSLLLLAVALTIHLKGLRSRRVALVLAGAALLGLGVNVREAALLFAPWLVFAPLACGWKLRPREMSVTGLACLVFVVCAFGPFVFLLWSNAANFRWAWHGWIESSRMESARHPVSIGNMLPLLRYFFIAAPLVFVAFPLAAIREWKQRGLSPLLALAIIGLAANLSLTFHYSVAINWRYVLTGMPALTPLVANHFLQSQTPKLKSAQRAFASIVLSILFIAVIAGLFSWPMGRAYVAERALARDYRARLALVPRDAVMISGTQTVAVTYWRGLGAGEWDVIGSGGAWPGAKLAAVIATALTDGRRVFLDADQRWWLPAGWQCQETVELVGIESRFRFHRISDTIYEIRPLHDGTALDQPHLSRLLPSKRVT